MKPQPRYSRSCFFITQQYILHLRYSPALFGLTLCYIGLVYLINTLGLLPRFFAEAFDPLVLWGAMVQLALLTAVTGACALTTMAMLIMPRFVLANLGYYARELVSHLYRNMAFLLARIWLPLAVLLVLHVLLPRFLAWTLPFRLSHPLAATFFSLLVESWLLLQAMSCLAVLFSREQPRLGALWPRQWVLGLSVLTAVAMLPLETWFDTFYLRLAGGFVMAVTIWLVSDRIYRGFDGQLATNGWGDTRG